MRGAALSTGLRWYFFADRCQELDTASVPGAGIAPSAAEQTCSACPAIVSSELADRSERPITERPITAPGSRWTGFWRRRAVQFPTVAKRAVAANGAAAAQGTAGRPKKALSKRHQATPRGGTPAIAAGANGRSCFRVSAAQIADPDAHLARFGQLRPPVSNSAQQAKIPRKRARASGPDQIPPRGA